MKSYSIINLKTDPELKVRAVKVADKLGVSISAILNNELRRLATEQSVIFEIPESPNAQTAKQLTASRKLIGDGDFHSFPTNKKALEFLETELK